MREQKDGPAGSESRGGASRVPTLPDWGKGLLVLPAAVPIELAETAWAQELGFVGHRGPANEIAMVSDQATLVPSAKPGLIGDLAGKKSTRGENYVTFAENSSLARVGIAQNA